MVGVEVSGIMSITGASPRFCKSKMLRMLQDPKAPHFEKTMTHLMLQRPQQVGIPVKFIRTHGDKLHTLLFLTGPNGHSRPVMLKVRTNGPYGSSRHYDSRVYLGRGWIEFVKENGFQVGDRIIFRMVEMSTFRVLVCSELQEKAVFKNASHSGMSSKDDEGSGRSNYRTKENGVVLEASLPPKVTTNQETTVLQKCETNFNPAESPVQQSHCGSADKAKVVAVTKTSPILGEEDFNKHPGLASAVSLGSRFPQFVKKLTKCSVMCEKDTRLELPLHFVKEHGHKFQAHVFLLGPSGGLRIVSLRILPTGSRNGEGSRVQIGQGWKEFSLENGFKEGDVLLFSLVGLSKFVVQAFPSV